MYSFSRLGSLEVVFWIPGGFSLDPCAWRFGSLECILLIGLDPWRLFLDPWRFFVGSLHLALWIPGVYSFSRLGSLECILLVGLDPWRLFFGSLEVFLWIPAPGALDPWSVFF